MDTYMHKTMVGIVSLEKIEIIRNQEFMPSEARQKFLKKMIILGPKTAILGPQFCRILVLGPHFWWSVGARAPGAPTGSAPGQMSYTVCTQECFFMGCSRHELSKDVFASKVFQLTNKVET